MIIMFLFSPFSIFVGGAVVSKHELKKIRTWTSQNGSYEALTAVFLGDVSSNVTIFQVTLQRAALDHRHMRPHGWQRDQGSVFPRQKGETLGAQPDEVRWVWGYPNAYHGTAWWLNQPIWKLCSSNWIHLPNFRGENKNRFETTI